MAAALLAADGESRIEDRVFEKRFACAEGFRRMGARVETEGCALRISPCAGLHGAQAAAPDLRGGAALAVAALGARGKSRITGCEFIARGYASLGGALSALVARIG